MFRYLARTRLGWAVFVLVAIGSIAAVLYFLHRGQKRVQHLYVPKLLMLRIDDVPYSKGGRRLPVDAMAGTNTVVTCENITPPPDMGNPAYRFHVGGETFEPSRCRLELPVSQTIGSTQTIGLEYLLKKPDGSTQVIDRWEAQIRSAPSGEYFRIRNFGNRDRQPLSNLTVPREVIPYVEAALTLDRAPDEYIVLFFVQEIWTNLPVLQVSGRPRAAEKFEVVSAPLTRYRGFGTRIGGYAAWPVEPIQVGNPEDERKVFEVYAGLFESKKVPSIIKMMVSFEGVMENGQSRIKVHTKRLSEIKALAWHGWLSEPIRVVRGAATAPGENAASALSSPIQPL